jgi:hypothetical protein
VSAVLLLRGAETLRRPGGIALEGPHGALEDPVILDRAAASFSTGSNNAPASGRI